MGPGIVVTVHKQVFVVDIVCVYFQLEVGQTVMVNYNPDAPRLRGFWYDGVVTRKVRPAASVRKGN